MLTTVAPLCPVVLVNPKSACLEGSWPLVGRSLPSEASGTSTPRALAQEGAPWTAAVDHGDSSVSSSVSGTPCPAPARPTEAVGDLVRFRHNWGYDWRKPVSAGTLGLALCKGSLPRDVTALTGGSLTPEPAAHLTHCKHFTFAELNELGLMLEGDARQLRNASAATNGLGTTAVMIGQLVHGLTPLQLLGLFHKISPGVRMTLPETHSQGRGIGAGKGSCHVRVLNDATAIQRLLRADRACYHDCAGVWIATDEQGRKELALFEELMLHYRNGVATGRPLGLMTVCVAFNQRLGLPTVSRKAMHRSA